MPRRFHRAIVPNSRHIVLAAIARPLMVTVAIDAAVRKSVTIENKVGRSIDNDGFIAIVNSHDKSLSDGRC